MFSIDCGQRLGLLPRVAAYTLMLLSAAPSRMSALEGGTVLSGSVVVICTFMLMLDLCHCARACSSIVRKHRLTIAASDGSY